MMIVTDNNELRLEKNDEKLSDILPVAELRKIHSKWRNDAMVY